MRGNPLTVAGDTVVFHSFLGDKAVAIDSFARPDL
jgi:hypothetical protein